MAESGKLENKALTPPSPLQGLLQLGRGGALVGVNLCPPAPWSLTQQGPYSEMKTVAHVGHISQGVLPMPTDENYLETFLKMHASCCPRWTEVRIWKGGG